MTMWRLQFTQRVAALIAWAIAIVPFHSFLTIWLSKYLGHFFLLRLWIEAVLLIVFTWAVYLFITWKKDKIDTNHHRKTLWKLIGLYLGLIALLGAWNLLHHNISLKVFAFGVVLDTRFLLWMLAVAIIAQRSTWLRTRWHNSVLWPFVIMTVFALLQFFVLPNNFLDSFGYRAARTDQFVSYVTLNQDSQTLRVQSFARGVNPFGAYLVACLAVLAIGMRKMRKIYLLPLLTIGTVALFLTFSRSAWLGLIVTLLSGGLFLFRKHWRALLYIGLATCIGLGTAAYIFRNNSGVQNAVLHESQNSTAVHTSNDGHYGALQQAIDAITDNPLGYGPGSAGQASWYNAPQPIRNTESYLLQVLVEYGIAGFILFMGVIAALARALWLRRNHPLALALFISIPGMLVINLFSYGWADESLAFIWWGLAGIAIGTAIDRADNKSIARHFINANRWLSKKFDTVFIPKNWCIDGLHDFVYNLAPQAVEGRKVIYDIGGGKRPFVGTQLPKPAGTKVIGIDIDANELKNAPKGAY